MNQQQFRNAWSQFSKGSKGPSLGGVLLFGLGYLALNSYYYGTLAPIQLISATTQSSSTNSLAPSPQSSTAKVSTSRSPSLKHPSSTMCRPEKTKFLQRLPTETCKASSSPSEYSSTLKSISWTSSTATLGKIMSRRSSQPSATRSSGPSLPSSQPLSCSVNETRCRKGLKPCSRREPRTSTSL
jgi:hypothetical protein